MCLRAPLGRNTREASYLQLQLRCFAFALKRVVVTAIELVSWLSFIDKKQIDVHETLLGLFGLDGGSSPQ